MDERSYFGISGKSPGVTQSPNAFKASNFPYKHKRTYKQPQQSPKLAVMSRNERIAQYYPNRITHQNRTGQKQLPNTNQITGKPFSHAATAYKQYPIATTSSQTTQQPTQNTANQAATDMNYWQPAKPSSFFQISTDFETADF